MNDQNFRGARTAVWLLLAINIFNYVDRQILAAVIPNIRAELLDNGQHSAFVSFIMGCLKPMLGGNPENALIGLLAMAFMVTYMVAAPIFGALRLNRWWIVGIGVTLWSVASGGSGLAMTFGALILTRCLVGIGEAAYGPIAPTVISDLYPVKTRGRVLSWLYLAIPIGSAIGFMMGGWVAAHFGWRWAFYLVVPPGVLLGIVCFFMKEPKRGQADGTLDDKAHTLSDRIRHYKVILRTPSFVYNTLGMAAMTFAIGGIGFWMPSYIHEFRGVGNLAQVNFIFGAILVVAGLAGTLLGGMLGDKLRERFKGSYFLVSGAAMLVALPFSIGMLYAPFPWAWVCIFIACFCLFFNTGPTNTIIANVTHPTMRASAYALNILVIHALGDVISPLVIGAVTDANHNNMNVAFLVVSSLVAVGGVLWLLGARHLDRDTNRALTAK